MAATYLQGGGAAGSPSSTLSKAFASNVSAGSLVVVVGMKYTGGSDDPFVASDCTKSAGTATLGTISLDKTYSYATGVPTNNWQVVGVFSAVVTGAGSLTMQLTDGASRYWLIGVAEFSGSWDASRVEDATGQGGTATDGTTAATTSNITTAGAGLMVGGISVTENNNHPGSITEDAAWSLVYEDENGSADNCGSMIYRIVSSGTTDAASWTLDSDQLGYAAAAVAYKEAASSGTTITPGAGTVTLAGAAPSATKTANQWSTPAAGAVSLTGYAPSVQNGASYTITPGAGSLTITGAAPVLTLTLPAPGSGAILLTGYAPTVLNGASYSVTPGAGSVVLSGAVPSVAATANKWVTPAAGALVLTGYAPSVQNGQSYAVTPPAGSVTITGAAPTVVRTAHQWVTPGSGAVVLTGAAPSASQAGSWNLTPGAGAIQITGYAPTVIGPRNVGAGRSTGRRRRVIVRDRVYMVNERDIPALLEAELLDRAPPKTAEVVEGPKPRKRIKKAAQPIKTVEQVQEAVEQIKARIEPENAWLMQALEAVAYRVLERLQDEEDSIMLLVA